MSRDSLSICLCGRIHLGSEMRAHTWKVPELYQIWTVTQENQTDWPKETRKKCSIKVIHCHEGVIQWLSLSLNLPMCLSTHTVLFFLSISTLLASLLSVFVEILFSKARGPGPLSLTTNLVARIRCFHYRNLASVFGWEPKPHSSLCRPRPPKIIMRLTPVFLFPQLSINCHCYSHMSMVEYGLTWWLSGKESTCNARDAVQSLGLEDPLEESTATHLLQSKWGAWWAAVHRVAKSPTRLKWLSTHAGMVEYGMLTVFVKILKEVNNV